MNTARIVVLTIAIGAGGIAAYPASGSDDKPAAPAEPTAQLQTVDVLVAKSDIGLGQTQAIQPTKRGESINVVRYGVASPLTMQK
jgi:Flp pilus assembly protein CpaB